MKAVKTNNSYIAYVLLLLLILYTLKGALYPTGIISMSIATAELGICFILAILALKYRKRNYVINVLYITIVLVSVSFVLSSKVIFTSLLGKISTFTFFREFVGAVLPALGVYYLARSGKLSLRLLTFFFYLVFISAIIAFFYETMTLMIDLNKQELTSNSAYRFVYIMPFVVFLRNKLNVVILWLIALSLALLSAKRGAILGLTLECAVYYWWSYRASRHKGCYIVGISVICVIGAHYLYQYYEQDDYVKMRVEATLEGKTSGRDVILNKLMNHYLDAGLMEMVKGAGFAQTSRIAGNYAHNDWMEMLIDFGMIGLMVYGLFYLALLKSIRHSRGNLKRIQLLILIAFLPTSFYSMVFFSEGSSIGFFWLGFIIGCKDRISHANKAYNFSASNENQQLNINIV